MIEADKFLEDLTGRHARLYFAAIHDLFVATVRGNKVGALDARKALDKVARETMGAAEILGAVTMLKDAAREVARQITKSNSGAEFTAGSASLLASTGDWTLYAFAATPTQTILPRTTLAEAIDDMVARTPVTIRRAAERTAQRISEVYSSGQNVAFARAAEASVTREAQNFITRALREGIPAGEGGRALAMSVNDIRKRSKEWSEGYARMAFRTNVNTAVTAGRFRQAQDPDIKTVVPAFRFDSVGDSDTRHNHDAADGLIFNVDNVAWNRLAPPLGYNCRCQISPVPRVELEQMGRIDGAGNVIESRVPRDAFPDNGFRHSGRADLFGVGR